MSVSTQHLQVAVDGDLALAVSAYDADRALGTPVLLLHGLSQQRFFWGPVIDRLHARPVASLDQRGHGDSDTPLSADYSIDACAHATEATLDVLGWPRAVIAGHSWGAWVGLRAAARAAVCEARPSADSQPDPTRSAREQQLTDAARRANLLIHRWAGAIHDVPLQWPSLVAGFIDSLVDDIDGAEHRAGAAAPVGGTA